METFTHRFINFNSFIITMFECSDSRVDELNKEIECFKNLLEAEQENERELQSQESKIRCELEEVRFFSYNQLHILFIAVQFQFYLLI